jgi:hypothetical protein
MALGKEQAEGTTRSRDGTWAACPFAFRANLCNIELVGEVQIASRRRESKGMGL